MGAKKKLFNVIAAPFFWLFRNANLINVNLIEGANLIHKQSSQYGQIKFFCPTNLTLFRAKTLFSKEPDTISWIDSFSRQDVLYDIGANVGTYSIYAGLKGIKVLAFEPESQNYAVLNRNIYLNNVQDKVDAFNLAISNVHAFDYLYISEFTIGGALNNFGEGIDYNKQAFKPAYKQAILSFTLDEVVERYNLPIPTHIKIDVDGLERLIIDGASQVLASPKVKSVLIELNEKLKEDMEILELLTQHGFELTSRYHAPYIDGSPFKDVYNYIFTRG